MNDTARGLTARISDAWRGIPSPVRKYVLPAVLVLVALTYPYWNGWFDELPFFGRYVPGTNFVVEMLIFTMMAVSLNVVVGYAGLLDLGYVAFYAIGAYSVAIFASTQFGGTNEQPQTLRFLTVASKSLPGVHISIWILLIFAAVVTAILGVLIGLPTLRLRGDYLAIVTLGFGEILPQIARNGDNLFGTGFNLTGGPSGITPVDPPGFGQTLSDVTGGFLPDSFRTGTREMQNRLFFWTALALLLLTIFCCLRLRESRLGRAWVAIREDETAAAAMGIPLMRTKTWAYAVGAFFGGLAGGFYASFKSAAFAEDFFFQLSIFILCMVILGGMGNIWGVIVGALFLSYLDRFGISTVGQHINESFGTNFEVPKYTFMIFGIILLVTMLFRPEGLFPEARRKAEFQEAASSEEVV